MLWSKLHVEFLCLCLIFCLLWVEFAKFMIFGIYEANSLKFYVYILIVYSISELYQLSLFCTLEYLFYICICIYTDL